MILRKIQSLICLSHSYTPLLEEPHMSNPCLSICYPHVPVRGLQRRENWQSQRLLVRDSWRHVSPKRQAAPLALGGWTKKKRGGEGRDGNGQVPGADLENRRGKAARALSSGRQVVWPRKLKISSSDWQNCDAVATKLEVFLILQLLTYIISIYKWVNWGSLSSEKKFPKVTWQGKARAGFEPRGHAFCH